MFDVVFVVFGGFLEFAGLVVCFGFVSVAWLVGRYSVGWLEFECGVNLNLRLVG